MSGRSQSPGHNVGVEGLESESQRKLNVAWKIVLSGDLAHRRATEIGVGRIELCTVESVEELSTELHGQSFVRAKRRVFEEREVEVVHTLRSDVGFGTGVGSITVVRRAACGEHGSVKPML